jgi:hypothetical protein
MGLAGDKFPVSEEAFTKAIKKELVHAGMEREGLKVGGFKQYEKIMRDNFTKVEKVLTDRQVWVQSYVWISFFIAPIHDPPLGFSEGHSRH